MCIGGATCTILPLCPSKSQRAFNSSLCEQKGDGCCPYSQHITRTHVHTHTQTQTRRDTCTYAHNKTGKAAVKNKRQEEISRRTKQKNRAKEEEE